MIIAICNQKGGFYAQAVVENIKEYSVWIVFTYENKRYRLHLGKVVNDEESSKDAEGRIAEIESSEKVIDIVEKLEKAISNIDSLDYTIFFAISKWVGSSAICFANRYGRRRLRLKSLLLSKNSECLS